MTLKNRSINMAAKLLMYASCILSLPLLVLTSDVDAEFDRSSGFFFGREISATYDRGDVNILTTYHDVSLRVCAKRCSRQLRCEFVNYRPRSNMCYLIEHFNKEFNAMELFKTKKGSILGVKAEWTWATGAVAAAGSTVATVVNPTNKRVCGPPENVKYAERLGNIYTTGSKVMYRCTKSHDKTTTVTCLSTGQWESQDLICYPDECYTNDELWVHDNSCYVFLWKESVESAEAQASCARLGGYLTIVRDESTQDFVEKILNYYREGGKFGMFDRPKKWVWIGLSDEEQEGDFKWSDNTVPTFTNWNGNGVYGEPNGGVDQDCVVLGNWHYRWADVSCTGDPFLTLCEIRVSGYM